MIIPSIDIQKGKAVQLKQGRIKIMEGGDPFLRAEEFVRYGDIAVVDLDRAVGTGDNDTLVEALCRRLPCRVGGGIRSLERARDVLSWGAEKIIIGTSAFSEGGLNRPFLTDLQKIAGSERIIIALDCWENRIVTRGWKRQTGIALEDVAREAAEYASELLFTQVEREGGMQGIDHGAVSRLRRSAGISVTAAGGIATPEEIAILSGMDADAQLGMAIYTGKMDLGEAFIAACRWDGELIPTLTRDDSGQPLMLAYSSRESLRKTFATGNVWYHSRSRNALWMKGEDSGNIQEFLRIRMDCDNDALLVTARQSGVACHKGRYSCWGAKEFSLDELYSVLRRRVKHPIRQSYSASLSMADVEAKIREESEEFIEAEGSEEIIWEGADILFFIMLKLARSGISPDEIMNELKRRRRTPHIPEGLLHKESKR